MVASPISMMNVFSGNVLGYIKFSTISERELCLFTALNAAVEMNVTVLSLICLAVSVL